ncbi:hypothetical protein Tco_0860365 [Tanacetum coccineum]|uniref:RNA-directed DNA polymerase, eukaryota n=1 Tax=Tanacetum coccineum TaxID=301880 RepID=A0ABQ5BIJ4_9ASTR
MATQNLAKESLIRNLLEWDMKPENGLINTNGILKKEEWMMDLNHLEQLHRDDLKQKGRVRGAVEGDENTRFFHSTLNNKFSMFTMKGIHINGVWVESPDDIKVAALDHFSSRFKEDDISRPSFSSNLFHKLSTTDATFLESGFSSDEVKKAVWDCDSWVPVRYVKGMASLLGCSNDSLPSIYFGLPVGKRMRFYDVWSMVIDRFRDKLSCWKAKTLSIGGRITLIKSIREEKALWNIVIKELYEVDDGFNLPENQLGSCSTP